MDTYFAVRNNPSSEQKLKPSAREFLSINGTGSVFFTQFHKIIPLFSGKALRFRGNKVLDDALCPDTDVVE